MKTIKVKKTSKGKFYLDLADFSDLVDIEKVKRYSLEEVQDGETVCLILKFYNDKNELIETKG